MKMKLMLLLTITMDNYLVNRAYSGPDPDARLPDDLFNTMNDDDRRKLATMSSASKKSILRHSDPRKSQAPRERPPRQHPSEEDVEQFEEYDDDSPGSIITKMHSPLVNATAGATSSLAPSRTTPSIEKKNKKSPLKSALTKAHTASLLSDNKQEWYLRTAILSPYKDTQMPKCIDGCQKPKPINKIRSLLRKSPTMCLLARSAKGTNKVSSIVEQTEASLVPIARSLESLRTRLTGLDNHCMPNVKIINVGTLCHSNRGLAICIF